MTKKTKKLSDTPAFTAAVKTICKQNGNVILDTERDDNDRLNYNLYIVEAFLRTKEMAVDNTRAEEREAYPDGIEYMELLDKVAPAPVEV